MELNRTELVAALKTVEPALASRDLIPMLCKFWFTGEAVQATNGIVGIEVPLATDFTGGIPGKVLLGFVDSLHTEHIKAVADKEGSVLFSDGRAKIRLPLEPSDNNIWPFIKSNAEPEAEIVLDDAWRQGLALAMISVTNNTTIEERRGVTLAPEDGVLNIYATDGISLSRAKMPLPWDPEERTVERFTAPGDFVKEVLRSLTDGASLSLVGGRLEATGGTGVRVCARLTQVDEPSDFRGILQAHAAQAELIELPAGFRESLERVELLKDDKDGVRAKLTFTKEGTLVVEGHSDSLGDYREEFQLGGEQQHDALNVKFTPSLVLRGLEGRTKFVASKRCIILTGPNHMTYLAAAYGG